MFKLGLVRGEKVFWEREQWKARNEREKKDAGWP